MGRFDRYTNEQLEDDDFIASLLGAQEEGDSALPRVPGPYDHLSDEEASDPDVLDALLGAQEEGDTTASMRGRAPYSVDIGEAQLRPEAPQVSMAPQAPAVPRAPQGPQGPSGAPAPMSRKAGDALAKQQEQSFQRNAKGGWDSSQYGDVESIAADDPSIAKLNHNSAPFKDQGSRPGARIDAITGQPLEGADELDGLLEEEPPMQSRMDVGPVEMLSGDGIGANPYHEDDALSELAGEVPQAPQAPMEPQAQQAPQDPGQMAYAQRVAEARRAGELFRQRQQSEPQEDYERYSHEASQGYRQTDDDLQRMWAINTIFGKEGDNFKAVAMGRQMQDAYDQRVQHGQQLDQRYAQHRKPAPTDADAELLALNWNISPESASGGRINPDLVKGIGPTASRRDLQDSKSADIAATNATRRDVGAGHDDATKYRADQHLAGVQLQHNPEDQADPAELAATLIQQKLGDVPRSTALGWANGVTSYSHLSPAAQRKIETAIASAPQIAKNPKQANALLARMEGSDAAIPDKHEADAGDPDTLYKVSSELEKDAGPFIPAFAGIQSLRKAGKLELLTKVGAEGFAGMVRNGKMTGDEAKAAASALKFVGAYAHGQYGANFTDGERQQLAKITGIRFGGGFDPTAHPEVIYGFFTEMKKILRRREANAFEQYPGLRKRKEQQ